MSSRQALPGETISQSCGVHCGLRSAAEGGEKAVRIIGHCPCDECRCVFAVVELVIDPEQTPGLVELRNAPQPVRRVPMCDSWQPSCYRSAIGAVVHGPGCPHEP